MNKLFVVFVFLVVIPVVSGVQMFGGESRTVYEYGFEESCLDVFVNVSASLPIEFTSQGVREYDLQGCVYQGSEDEFSDEWLCSCNGGFDLVLSVLPNTVNSYSFNMYFVLDEETVDEGGAGGQTFSVSSRGAGYCATEWSCSEWSDCIDGVQFRECSFPEGFCEPDEPRPVEVRECSLEESPVVEEEPIVVEEEEERLEDVPPVAPIAGAVVGVGGLVSWLWLAVLLLFILILFLLFFLLRKRNK